MIQLSIATGMILRATKKSWNKIWMVAMYLGGGSFVLTLIGALVAQNANGGLIGTANQWLMIILGWLGVSSVTTPGLAFGVAITSAIAVFLTCPLGAWIFEMVGRR